MLLASYARLAADAKCLWGHKPLHRHGWTDLAASRYVRQMQSRRTLLIEKVYGRRLDGWQNASFAFETRPGDPNSMQHTHGHRRRAALAFVPLSTFLVVGQHE